MAYSVLIVEDQPIASAGVRFTLETNPAFTLLADANSCNKARALLESENPELVILDVFLPDGSGLDILAEIKRESSDYPKVLLYSGQANPQEFATAMRLGAEGLLSKSDPPEELIIALEQIAIGSKYVSVSVKRMLALSNEAQLTEREQQVLQLLFQGFDNNRIAEKLNISSATIKKHRENILHKLDAPNIVAAIRTGMRLGILDVNAR